MVLLEDGEGEPLGAGIFDPASPLAVRVWTHGHDPVGPALFRERIRGALALRASLVSPETTAYRLLHGEGDRTPGFVVDRYGPVAVLKIDGDGAQAHRGPFVEALEGPLREAGVETLVIRGGDRGEAKTVEVAFGAAPTSNLVVTEHGIPFVVDVLRGQKTGAFLDQRENRRRVGALAEGRRMLNLFSYAGGFSLHGALGGATEVTSVDVAAAAHSSAQASFRHAGVDPRQHRFVTADAFAFLDDARKRGERWDLVVSDPPSFAPSEKAVPRAVAAYRALHRACAQVLSPGGLFCAASCSSHVDAATFAATLDDETLAMPRQGALRLLETHGAPWDHPTLPAWPEGRYLKFFVLG